MSATAEQLQLSEILRSKPYVVAAWLFGSRAREQARFDSDVDIAILGNAPLSATQRHEITREVVEALGTPVDLIDLEVEHGYVAREAFTKGKLLFCKSPPAYQRRLRELVYDAEDFLPALRAGQRKAFAQWIKTSRSAN